MSSHLPLFVKISRHRPKTITHQACEHKSVFPAAVPESRDLHIKKKSCSTMQDIYMEKRKPDLHSGPGLATYWLCGSVWNYFTIKWDSARPSTWCWAVAFLRITRRVEETKLQWQGQVPARRDQPNKLLPGMIWNSPLTLWNARFGSESWREFSNFISSQNKSKSVDTNHFQGDL